MFVRETRLLVLLPWLLLAAVAGADIPNKLNYGYIYWEYGIPTTYGGRRPQSQANLTARANPNVVIQTGYYSLRLDCDDVELTGYDALAGTDYLSALDDDVSTFTPAQLRLHVYKDGVRYTCSSGIILDTEESYVRLIENGQFVQRFDLNALVFTDSGGNDLGVKGRLEITAWPDRVNFLLDFRDFAGLPLATGITRTTIELNTGTQNHLADILDDRVNLAVQPHLDALHPDWNSADYLTETYDFQTSTNLSHGFDQAEHALKIEVPSSSVQFPRDLNRVDEFLIEVTNPDTAVANIPLVFEQPTPRAITGGVMVLCEENGAPSGIPVQMSKNWHKTAGEEHIHQGTWRRGSTVVTLAGGETKRFRLRMIYGHWAGVPAASHAQLSLIGWGTAVNWKWDESALGAWGENLTFDPSQHAAGAFMADVRPAFTPGYTTGTPYNWTENSGGGDFLIYYDQSNKFRWGKRLKTTYRWTGPNLTEVHYSGVTDDDRIRFTYKTRLARSYDYHRRFHSYKYEFLQNVTSPTRLVFHQMAADYYTGPTFDDYTVGDESGALSSQIAAPGGNTYKGSFDFENKWLVTEDLTASSTSTSSNRSLIMMMSKLNGATLTPHLHRYGRSWGTPSFMFDLSSSSVSASYAAGDVVEGTLEFLMPPKSSSLYWGGDSEFAGRLTSYTEAWDAAHDESRYNDLAITTHVGTTLNHYPVEIDAASGYVLADFTINSGGIGDVPIVIYNAPRGNPVTVQRYLDGSWVSLESVNLSTHDYYQGVQNADGLIDYAFNIRRPTSDLSQSWKLRVVGGSPSDSLVAHWPLDESSGTLALDRSGHGFDATIAGAGRVGGVLAGALDFDAGSDSVSLPQAAFIGIDDEISISMWAFGDTSQPRADSVFYAVNASGDRVLNIHLPWSNSSVYWDAGFSGTYDRILKLAEPEDFMGRWNHWVFTKNASTGSMRIYLNGQLWHSNTTSTTRSMAGITAATFGSQTSGSSYDGMIDDVRLYQVALSAGEVASLYNSYSGYSGWLGGFPELDDPGFTDDSDGDGMANGLEYVLNGNPMISDPMILPDPLVSGDDFVFTFTRRADSADDTSQVFQYGSDMSAWTDLNITSPTAAEVTLGEVVDGVQSVTVTISEEQAEDGQLFGRIVITSEP